MREAAERDHSRNGAAQSAGNAGARGRPIDLARLSGAVWRTRLWLLGVVVVSTAVSLPVARQLAPLEYRARASFLWEAPMGTDEDPVLDERALRTMVDSVELPTNLAEVRRRLRLPKTLPEIGGSVDVTTEDDSNLVLVTAKDSSASRAARTANTLVEVFLDSQRAFEERRRQRNLEIVRDDLRRARRELDEARRRYDAFRAEHRITDLAVDTQNAIEAAANLRAAADLARADATAKEARTKSLRDKARHVSKTTVREIAPEAPASSPERERLRQARLDLAEARSRLGPDHPDLRALEARVQAYQAEVSRAAVKRVAREPQRVIEKNARWEQIQGTVADIEAQRQVAAERSRNLRELESAADQRLRQLSAIESEASSLLAGKRVAEARVLELAELQARAVDAGRSAASGLRFVARARPPDDPESRNKQRAIMIFTPLIALLGTLAVVVVRAVRGLRVRSATELAYWGRGPVVGSTTWPRDNEALFTLVEELDDLYPESGGTTLVVGATPAEDEAASHLAAVIAETTIERVSAEPGPRRGRESELEEEDEADEEHFVAPPSRTALARIDPSRALAVTGGASEERVVKGWQGEVSGPALRRAARLADRVLVLVRAGALSPPEIASIRTRVGREDGIGYVLIDQEPSDEDFADRAGPVDEFWKRRRAR